jgi:hypothetical protein
VPNYLDDFVKSYSLFSFFLQRSFVLIVLMVLILFPSADKH